ncbi:hypothetical protein L3Q82_007413 [Scortum barcoo]|uniref:Uncharacterized protein n=1 Tax=Scortum barcoo TaxID=214431 RepID=A0ACB8WSX0_9TELE|nr:hypothetical protein L3Q82_007413 [Scortum barcoo]
MKTLERLFLSLLRPQVQHAQDRLQFTYQPGVGVEDAILYLLHRAHSHLGMISILQNGIDQFPGQKEKEKMQRCFGIFCVSLIFCATLSETIGLVIAAKEKRGWTLNSAGYLLGPQSRVHLYFMADISAGRIDHLIQIKDSPSARGRDELVTQYGIDGHRTLGDKPGLAGKRDMGQEEDFRTGALRIADGDIIHTVIDFLSYLKLKEMGALDSLPSSVTSDELANP